jgi:hypothetical protein
MSADSGKSRRLFVLRIVCGLDIPVENPRKTLPNSVDRYRRRECYPTILCRIPGFVPVRKPVLLGAGYVNSQKRLATVSVLDIVWRY